MRDAEALQQLASFAFVVARECKQHVLRSDIGSAKLARFVVRGE